MIFLKNIFGFYSLILLFLVNKSPHLVIFYCIDSVLDKQTACLNPPFGFLLWSQRACSADPLWTSAWTVHLGMREREGDRWLVRAVSRATDAPDQLSNARERARAFYVHARLGCSQDEAGENVWALVFGRRSPGKMSVMTPYRETRS